MNNPSPAYLIFNTNNETVMGVAISLGTVLSIALALILLPVAIIKVSFFDRVDAPEAYEYQGTKLRIRHRK